MLLLRSHLFSFLNYVGLVAPVPEEAGIAFCSVVNCKAKLPVWVSSFACENVGISMHTHIYLEVPVIWTYSQTERCCRSLDLGGGDLVLIVVWFLKPECISYIKGESGAIGFHTCTVHTPQASKANRHEIQKEISRGKVQAVASLCWWRWS